MAITAKFEADFNQFVEEAKKANTSLQDIENSSKKVVSSMDDMGQSWVSRVAEGLLLRDAINEVLRATKELILGVPEEAQALQTLSLQTQTNVEDLQVLAAATREYGVDGNQLGGALFQ